MSVEYRYLIRFLIQLPWALNFQVCSAIRDYLQHVLGNCTFLLVTPSAKKTWDKCSPNAKLENTTFKIAHWKQEWTTKFMKPYRRPKVNLAHRQMCLKTHWTNILLVSELQVQKEQKKKAYNSPTWYTAGYLTNDLYQVPNISSLNFSAIKEGRAGQWQTVFLQHFWL